ncbi:MAG: EscU/YscU/HrcU family type III secretion system export apparatus switch protein [Pseudomonadota bacterium]
MSGEKTEEPTEEKLRKAREKGQLPSRKNAVEVVLVATGVGIIAGTWTIVVEQMSGVFDAVLSAPEQSFQRSLARVYDASQGMILYTVAITGFMGLLTLLFTLLLNKFNFAPKALEPKFSKLNPVSGLKNMFSMNTVYNFLRMTTVFVTIFTICYVIIRGNMGDGIDASACGLSCLSKLFPSLLIQMVTLIIIVLLLAAAIDFRIQDMLFKKQQKMTKDEVKREYKNSEGDPHVRGARQSIAEENIYMPSMQEVTHVVYSNTLLVALLHVPNSSPIVVMKSKGRNVSRLQQKFRSMGKKCVNLPAAAADLHPAAVIGQHMEGKKAARGWFKVLAATGDL